VVHERSLEPPSSRETSLARHQPAVGARPCRRVMLSFPKTHRVRLDPVMRPIVHSGNATRQPPGTRGPHLGQARAQVSGQGNPSPGTGACDDLELQR
jgi:hypothetical protein